MRKYSSNLAFVDLLFNLLVGFTSLLLLAFLLINPVADEGKIDPISEYIVTATWPAKSHLDIDIWIKGPDGTVVSFRGKDGMWMVLERDDLGTSNDFYKVNGVLKIIERNLETLSINAIVPGEYVLNIQNYSTKRPLNDTEEYPVPVTVEFIKLNPFQLIFNIEKTLEFKQEYTIATFVIDEKGLVTDIRTDIQIPLFYKGPAYNNTGRDLGETITSTP
tara:strand:+ start:2084 stop:2740 length:657 start_codon:yes stop_codon:yes gene_type:complete